VKFVDQSGKPISAKMITNSPAKSADLLALIRLPDCSASLGAWFREQKMYVKDHVLVTILDWEQGVLQLRREPFGQQNPTLLAERNRLLADMLFDLLEARPENRYTFTKPFPQYMRVYRTKMAAHRMLGQT